jgi:hypothetical protein
METVRIKLKAVNTSGNRNSWFKLVTSVDRSKRDGYAFGGEFIKAGVEIDLPVGSIILEKEPTGSVKNNGNDGNVYKVVAEPDSENNSRNPHLELQFYYDWRREFLSLRDKLADLLESNQPSQASEVELLKAEIEALENQLAEKRQRLQELQ